MKKILFSLLVLAFSVPVWAQNTPDKVAKFKSDVIDLGKIEVGNPKTATFYFSNIGATPLIIEQANPTCGCTIGDYTKAPVAKGKDGWIKATYNAASLGAFDKKMSVKFAGVDGIKDITIKGEVLSKEDYAKYVASSKKSTTPAKP
ncbi:MAG TPA: DUF1573 domain-containing protein [Ferruginibacter sp.]|nr:DUF1573 domain-containing protein [Ferruginibacter sp.]HRO18093.1 DUF1573 domain-containing protein [Ferruginibacter sp.]HRQ21144.1 DUF1573 domain-containing protein [Ferruginibacter sp.]